jgi:putative membrane protein
MSKRGIFDAAVVVAGMVLAPGLIWAQQSSEPCGYGYGPHMMGWGGGWFGMVLGPIFLILTLAVLIGLGFILVRWLGGPWHGMHVQPGRAPLDILKERFARGEIDKQEFEERRRVLGE